MDYSDMITRAFRTLRSGSLWGFMATTQLATAGLFVVALAGGVLGLGGSSGLARLRAAGGTAGAADPGSWALLVPLFALLILAGLLAIPIGLVEHGGVIHLTDEFQAGRSTSWRNAWRFGMLRMGRTFLVDFVVGIIAFAIMLVATLPATLLIVASARNNGSGGGVVAAICGTGILLLIMGFALVMLSGYEALAIRYALIGDRAAGDAIGAASTAFRARFKSVFLLLLILIGFGIAFSMVQTAINYLLQFAAVGPLVLAVGFGGQGAGFSVYLAMLVGLFFVMSVFAMVMAIFMRIFQQGLWTSFFRQVTGLEPPARPVYQQAPVGTYYPPPYQPTVAWQPPAQPAPSVPEAASPEAAPAAPAPAPPQSPAPTPPAQPPAGPAADV